MVAGLKSKDYRERCQELGLETLEERRETGPGTGSQASERGTGSAHAGTHPRS
jgi:hypothetical protein